MHPAATISQLPAATKVGLEVVPFIQRRLFVSPPLMFCFKGCPTSISCGQCNQLVHSSVSENINSSTTTITRQNSLLEQLGDHYRFSFWISDSQHINFFSTHSQLDRAAYCVVCERQFMSIDSVLRHVREILLNPNMRTRKYHWLILDNLTNLFVNRDIGYVSSDQELVNLLEQLFPEKRNSAFFDGKPNFEQIFENLRSIMEAPSGLSSNCDSPSNQTLTSESTVNAPPSLTETLDSSQWTDTSDTELIQTEPSEAIDSECCNLGSEMVFIDVDNDGELQRLTFTSDLEVSSAFEEDELLSQVVETMRNESEVSENTSRNDQVIDYQLDQSSGRESENSGSEVEISWVSHHRRVTQWVSLRPPEPQTCTSDDGDSFDEVNQTIQEISDGAHSIPYGGTPFFHSNSSGGSRNDNDVIDAVHVFNAGNVGIRKIGNNTNCGILVIENESSLSQNENSYQTDSDISTFFEELDLSVASSVLRSEIENYSTGSKSVLDTISSREDESSLLSCSTYVKAERESNAIDYVSSPIINGTSQNVESTLLRGREVENRGDLSSQIPKRSTENVKVASLTNNYSTQSDLRAENKLTRSSVSKYELRRKTKIETGPKVESIECVKVGSSGNTKGVPRSSARTESSCVRVNARNTAKFEPRNRVKHSLHRNKKRQLKT